MWISRAGPWQFAVDCIRIGPRFLILNELKSWHIISQRLHQVKMHLLRQSEQNDAVCTACAVTKWLYASYFQNSTGLSMRDVERPASGLRSSHWWVPRCPFSIRDVRCPPDRNRHVPSYLLARVRWIMSNCSLSMAACSSRTSEVAEVPDKPNWDEIWLFTTIHL